MESKVPHPSQETKSAPSVAFVLTMLLIVNIFNFIDRQLPFILAEAIKEDLKLTDTQIGLLGGVAFAAVYSTFALPLARLADRWSAKWTIVGSLSVWSLLTAAGGLSQNFTQLLLARTGVAAGEAGSTPAAHSMITSVVPESRRSFAIAVFSLGVSLGGMLGLILGGWLLEMTNWRMAMILVGLPGLTFALLFALTMPDPRPVKKQGRSVSIFKAGRELLSLRSYRHLCIAMTVFGVGAYGIFTFTAPFLMRTYDLNASQAGLWLGLANGLSGVIGALSGGWLADRIGKTHPERVLWLPVVGFAISAPLIVAGFLAPSPLLSLLALAPVHAFAVFYLAPCFGTAQRLARADTRATSSAILLFGLSLIGASLGPFLTGLVSDVLRPQLGEQALRYALCGAAFFTAWAAIHLMIASRSLGRDIAVVRKLNEQDERAEAF